MHCTTVEEVEWNKALGVERCFVVPLGTSSSSWSSSSRLTGDSVVGSEGVGELGVGGKHTLLFVGRVHPVKGLVNLIKAWALCNACGWKLRIVGPDEAGHRAELEALVAKLGLGDRVEFAGPKFGDELSKEYVQCDCLALVSHTENFGATVVDAMAHGKPCIASTFTPWKELVERKCGWWVSNKPEKLANCIFEMINCGEQQRQEMGQNGLQLVREKYTWDAVADTMIAKYKEVLGCR